METLDIDRLHKLYFTKDYEKGCGKTTGVIHQAIGFSRVMTNTKIVIFVDNIVDEDYLTFELEKWLENNEIFSIESSVTEFKFNLQNYNSISVTTIKNFLHSVYNWNTNRSVLTLFDLKDKTSINYDSESFCKAIYLTIGYECAEAFSNEFK